MGITHDTAQATSRAVQTYNNSVRDDVIGYGHAALTSFRATEHHPSGYNIGGTFNVVGCGPAWSARKNTRTEGDGGVPIYWINGAKIADNNRDFYDGSWDSTHARTVDGTSGFGLHIFTGCNNDGTASANPLGGTIVPDLSGRTGTITHQHRVQVSDSSGGRLNSNSVVVAVTTVEITENKVDMWVRQPDGTYRQEKRTKTLTVNTSKVNGNFRSFFYAMSPIFTVEGGGLSVGRSEELERQFSEWQFSEQQQQPDTSVLEANIQERIDLTAQKNDHHSNRIWRGALAAVRGEQPTGDAREVDAAFAQRLADNHGARGRAELSSLWQEIADALNGVLPPPPPPPTPELSITGGAGVTEGQGAVFTITANPAPTSQVSVTVNVTQTGDFASVGAHTVIIPANTATGTLWVSTTNDALYEPDGSVTATLQAGSGFTLGASSSATIAILDNDAPTPQLTITGGAGVTEGGDVVFTFSASPAATSTLTVNLRVSQSGDFASSLPATITLAGGSATLRIGTVNDDADEPNGSITVAIASGSGYTLGASSSATVAVSDDDDPAPPPQTPQLSITGGAGVTEGQNAVFTITASPAATSTLTVNLNVSQSGDFASSLPHTVTLTGGSVALRIGTTNDSTDEPNGSITVALASGSGYSVGSAGSASVAVADDDDPAPPDTQDPAIRADLISRMTALRDEYEGKAGQSSNHFLLSWRADVTLIALTGGSSMANDPNIAPYHFRAAITAAIMVGDDDAQKLFAEVRDFLGVPEL